MSAWLTDTLRCVMLKARMSLNSNILSFSVLLARRCFQRVMIIEMRFVSFTLIWLLKRNRICCFDYSVLSTGSKNSKIPLCCLSSYCTSETGSAFNDIIIAVPLTPKHNQPSIFTVSIVDITLTAKTSVLHYFAVVF